MLRWAQHDGWRARHAVRLRLVAMAMALSVSACGGSSSKGGTVTVAAAADVAGAFAEAGKVFEQRTGNRVTFTFGSTGQLAQQIESGAPVDVFVAANVSYVEELERKGLVDVGTKALYGRGAIVLWTRSDSPLRLERVEDVLQDGVRRIAIANPEHAPYGAAAREALQKAGVWGRVQPKLVLGENVAQTLQYAQTGNVEAAMVALSQAMATEGGRWTRIPQELYSPIDQALAVIKGTKHEREARAFAAFINGPEGRPIMRRYGFALPGEEAGP